MGRVKAQYRHGPHYVQDSEHVGGQNREEKATTRSSLTAKSPRHKGLGCYRRRMRKERNASKDTNPYLPACLRRDCLSLVPFCLGAETWRPPASRDQFQPNPKEPPPHPAPPPVGAAKVDQTRSTRFFPHSGQAGFVAGVTFCSMTSKTCPQS